MENRGYNFDYFDGLFCPSEFNNQQMALIVSMIVMNLWIQNL